MGWPTNDVGSRRTGLVLLTRRVMGSALLCAVLMPWPVAWAATEPVPDGWFPGDVMMPLCAEGSRLEEEPFGSLRAEVLSGRLKVFWEEPVGLAAQLVTLVASVDAPGHWPARDWRRYPATRPIQFWEITLPVDDLDVPILYFLLVVPKEGQGVVRSPVRICRPRGLGMELPSRIFWPFLEGFEEDLDSWRLLSDDGETLGLSGETRNGHASLRVKVPAGKRSATVATTRVRGWQVVRQNARGLDLWLRTESGAGRARFTLHGHAFTTNQVMSVCKRDVDLGPSWQRVTLAFEDFRDPPLASLDLLSIELIGEGPCGFLVDDLQLDGNWRLD